MDISPLYELRARLRAAMISGTGLLSEDFRLKRAVEAFAPLEQASPVFAKIGQLSKTLLSPKAETKEVPLPEDTLLEDALLDAITLADAVLCTQGKVPVEGNVEPVAGSPGGVAVTNSPYSVVKTLTESLLTSGSGHYSYVLDTYREQPGLFKDYRVKPAMVQALGASYTELADTVEQWLKKEDASILPLLQKGFDPKGKKETIRRIHVMSAIDVKTSNEFFVKILPETEKEVRQALIFSLRLCPENVDLLLELANTEKGNAKKTACYALAYMEDQKAEAFFLKQYQKKPLDAMQYLVYTETEWASRFVAGKLKEQLSLLAEDHSAEKAPEPAKDRELPAPSGKTMAALDRAQLLGRSMAALPGKSGSGICEAFRMASGLENCLEGTLNGSQTSFIALGIKEVLTAGLNLRNRESVFTFQTSLPYLLHQALHCHPDEEICSLAVELYEAEDKRDSRRREFFPAAVAAQLLREGDCCDWLEEQRNGKLFPSNKEFCPLLARGLDGLRFDEKENTYVLRIQRYRRTHPSGEPLPLYCQPVKQKITGRFMDILIHCMDRDIDSVLMDCINPLDEACCRRLGDYFYFRAPKVKAARDYLLALKRCHYPKCEGLAVSYFTDLGRPLYLSDISGYAAILPGDRAAIYEELQRVFDLYKQGRIRLRDSRQGEEQFLDYLEQWKGS